MFHRRHKQHASQHTQAPRRTSTLAFEQLEPRLSPGGLVGSLSGIVPLAAQHEQAGKARGGGSDDAVAGYESLDGTSRRQRRKSRGFVRCGTPDPFLNRPWLHGGAGWSDLAIAAFSPGRSPSTKIADPSIPWSDISDINWPQEDETGVGADDDSSDRLAWWADDPLQDDVVSSDPADDWDINEGDPTDDETPSGAGGSGATESTDEPSGEPSIDVADAAAYSLIQEAAISAAATEAAPVADAADQPVAPPEDVAPKLAALPKGAGVVKRDDIKAAQLNGGEVEALLRRASAATPSVDAIIAIVDRGGTILGVRVEQGVLDAFDANDNNMIDAGSDEEELLVFAIDGAVAKARTAAFFSNGDPTNRDAFSPNGTLAPLTSRLVEFVSQSTITEREVNSNPNADDVTVQDARDSRVRGPGFVAPIGLGAHFPPGVQFTPPVDLFAIEHTNRDSIVHPGMNRVKGGGGAADNILLDGRFDVDVSDPAVVDPAKIAALRAPESYGFQSNRSPDAQARGIATLPGGLPIYRDVAMLGGKGPDGVGDTLIGGIGVFFPGQDGFATFEQNYVPGIGQTKDQRTNAPKVLEAEFIALAAVGGSVLAGVPMRYEIGNTPAVEGIDLPFGRLDLVGIQLRVLGPIAGVDGVTQLVQFGLSLGAGQQSGDLQPIDAANNLSQDGKYVPEGWIVKPQDAADGSITKEDVKQIIEQGIARAGQVRAAIRLTIVPSEQQLFPNVSGVDARPGSRTRMVFSVTDKNGEVLGLYRMPDATIFSIDVAVAKARNTAYYADPVALRPADFTPGVPTGTAYTNRTFRFLAEPRFPDGIDGTPAGPFSLLNDPGTNPATGEGLGKPPRLREFVSVLGFDAFNPGTNFRDARNAGTNPGLENGIVFFPGSTPIYKRGELVGGFGVSGDGVDQDDVVTAAGAVGYLPPIGVLRADDVSVRGVRLPYFKFNRNPLG